MVVCVVNLASKANNKAKNKSKNGKVNDCWISLIINSADARARRSRSHFSTFWRLIVMLYGAGWALTPTRCEQVRRSTLLIVVVILVILIDFLSRQHCLARTFPSLLCCYCNFCLNFFFFFLSCHPDIDCQTNDKVFTFVCYPHTHTLTITREQAGSKFYSLRRKKALLLSFAPWQGKSHTSASWRRASSSSSL